MAEYGALKPKRSLKLVYRGIHISDSFRIFITCLYKEALWWRKARCMLSNSIPSCQQDSE
jgi:hypothetical protein